MGFKLEDIIDNVTKFFTDNQYLKSPLWTAVIIVAILLITMWFVLYNETETVYEDTSMIHLYAKIGIWTFVTTLLVLFLHNKSVGKIYEEKYKNIKQEQIVQNVVQTATAELPTIAAEKK